MWNADTLPAPVNKRGHSADKKNTLLPEKDRVMSKRPHFVRSLLLHALVGCLALMRGAALVASASPLADSDPDYETISPASKPAEVAHPVPQAAIKPRAPQAAGRPAADEPRMRFMMRDGESFVGRVISFDGDMYALQLPHSTLLARRDMFTRIMPLAPSKHGNASFALLPEHDRPRSSRSPF